MAVASPGFIGERLKEARLARGLTGVALCNLVEVKPQSISAYEHEKETPSPEVVDRLAVVLDVPKDYFWADIRRSPVGTLFFRARARATKMARDRATTKLAWLMEMVHFLETYLSFPEVQIPFIDRDPLQMKDEEIEEAAVQVRESFGLGRAPVPNLVAVLENRGVVISRHGVGTEDLDAYSQWCDHEQRPYMILTADKDSAFRSRLDAAHELGHMVLHRTLDPKLIQQKDVFKRIEEQAFRFAGAFLLPAAEFSDDFFLPSMAELRRLKDRWGVSMAAILKRCDDLELLPEKEITRLWISLSRYRKREPGDAETAPELPEMLKNSVELLVNERVLARADIRDALRFGRRDIEMLAGLESHYLSDREPAPVAALRPRHRDSTPARKTTSEEETGQVVQFPRRDP